MQHTTLNHTNTITHLIMGLTTLHITLNLMRYSIYLPYLIARKNLAFETKHTIIVYHKKQCSKFVVFIHCIFTVGYILYAVCFYCTCRNYWMNVRTNSLGSFRNTYLFHKNKLRSIIIVLEPLLHKHENIV